VLHIEVVSQPAATPRLIARLAADPGVLNLVVLPGAAVAHAASAGPGSPAGDAVQFDVTVASANAVLAQLRQLGTDSGRPIIVETIDAALADGPRRPAWRPVFHADRAPVWDLVHARIGDEANYTPSFFALLIFAGLIGACGILTNSQILIVGAMVVGPEYGAIISVALGIERRDGRTVGRGLLVLLVGFAAAIAVTLAFALCIRAAGHTPKLYLRGVRPVSDLINSPNLFSVVVAVVAALVGVVSLTLARSSTLIGVFISVTTIPAAADIAVSIAYGGWREARGSTLQLLLNVGLLIIVGALGLRGQRLIWRRWTASSGAVDS
jgi:uncharacterized hydrophobic protein (TIGR00271 family)